MMVIALDAPGAREVVRHNCNGVLLDGDAVSHPGKTAAWQKCALQTAQDFSRKVCAQKLLDLYAHAISQENGDMEIKETDMELWEMLLVAIQTEWNLISEKAQTIARTFT